MTDSLRGAARDDPAAPRAAAAGPADAGAAALAAVVDELELLSRFDRDGAGQRAEQVAVAARDLGLPELELRAQLVVADLVRRRGDVAEAGRLAQHVHRWAADNHAPHVLARSHFLLAAVYQELGDLSQALGHAVQSVDLLDDDGPPALRIDHRARLADCLGLHGDGAAARERYADVLQLAEDLGDVDRQLLVLNNRAYVETLTGEYDTALALSTQLLALAAEHGIPLHVGRLDTVARALMGLGRLAEAEEALLPGFRPEALDASPDGDAGADFLLTLAEIQRARGRVTQAQATLDECVRRCERHGLTSIRVRARREQAELHAADGDFRAAFAEHKLYCQEALDLQSAQRDARARTLQAMHETTEARQQSRRYRELSLRDPLTGLFNRRYVDEQLPRLLGRAGLGEVLSLALLDLDHFKRVNDTCSHAVGDRVLQRTAHLLEAAVSAGEAVGTECFAARMGGEEFLLVQVGAGPENAARRLEDLRRSVAQEPWSPLTGAVPVTVSIGAVSTQGHGELTPSELLSRADACLYRAKREGRDRVVGTD